MDRLFVWRNRNRTLDERGKPIILMASIWSAMA